LPALEVQPARGLTLQQQCHRAGQGYLLGKPVPVSQLDFTSAASPAEMVA